jgi:hypothetical protein
MKSKIISELKKSGLEFPQSRGEVSVQEQLKAPILNLHLVIRFIR